MEYPPEFFDIFGLATFSFLFLIAFWSLKTGKRLPHWVMMRKIVSVHEDTSIKEAAVLLADHGIDGMPVIDQRGVLLGIVTEYDLIGKGSAIHLPTFQHVLEQLKTSGKISKDFAKDIKEIEDLKVVDVMNPDPLKLTEDATFEHTVQEFRDHHRVNPIPVVDKDNKVVGVVSRFDVLKPMRLLES